MMFQRCKTHLCKNRMPRRATTWCCNRCWSALPQWLRTEIQTERDNCRLAGIKHSQALLALRDKALAILNARNQERFAPPQGEQLRLV